jgi:hypothetical protein
VSGIDILLFRPLQKKKPDRVVPNRALEKRIAATLDAPFPEPWAGPRCKVRDLYRTLLLVTNGSGIRYPPFQSVKMTL